MGLCKSVPAERGECFHGGGLQSLHGGFDLRITQLPHIKVPRRTERIGHPAKKDITGGLHDSLANYDALAVMKERAPPCVRLQHRRPGLLELQEQGIAVTGHEERDAAKQPDASDADHFVCLIDQFVSIDKDAAFDGKRSGVVGRRLDPSLCKTLRLAPRVWKISGGVSRILTCRPWTTASLANSLKCEDSVLADCTFFL